MIGSMSPTKKGGRVSAKLVAGIAIVLLFALATLGRRAWESYKYPVDIRELRRLKAGATETDVLRLFGIPQQMHGLYGDWRWCYYRSNRIGIIYVIFDANKRYKGFEFDD